MTLTWFVLRCTGGIYISTLQNQVNDLQDEVADLQEEVDSQAAIIEDMEVNAAASSSSDSSEVDELEQQIPGELGTAADLPLGPQAHGEAPPTPPSSP
jgi:TolA-binding protein